MSRCFSCSLLCWDVELYVAQDLWQVLKYRPTVNIWTGISWHLLEGAQSDITLTLHWFECNSPVLITRLTKTCTFLFSCPARSIELFAVTRETSFLPYHVCQIKMYDLISKLQVQLQVIRGCYIENSEKLFSEWLLKSEWEAWEGCSVMGFKLQPEENTVEEKVQVSSISLRLKTLVKEHVGCIFFLSPVIICVHLNNKHDDILHKVWVAECFISIGLYQYHLCCVCPKICTGLTFSTSSPRQRCVSERILWYLRGLISKVSDVGFDLAIYALITFFLTNMTQCCVLAQIWREQMRSTWRFSFFYFLRVKNQQLGFSR